MKHQKPKLSFGGYNLFPSTVSTKIRIPSKVKDCLNYDEVFQNMNGSFFLLKRTGGRYAIKEGDLFPYIGSHWW